MRNWFWCLFFISANFLLAARNPFYSLNEKKGEPFNLRLSGIAKFKGNYSCMLSTGKDVHMVFKGMNIDDYFVNDINEKFVIVSRNGITKKLTI